MKLDEDLFSQISTKLKQATKTNRKCFTGGERGNAPPLWVFLVELLALDTKGEVVRWTYRLPYEFVVTNPKQIAAMWGCLKNNPRMNYTYFCRAIRYYYRKNIIEKVADSAFTYRFVRSPLTAPFLARCFSNQFASNCPLMKEPGYLKIREYVSQNNFPSTKGFQEENFAFNSRPRLDSQASLDSFTSTDDSVGGFEELSDSSSVCSSVGSSYYSVLSLKESLRTYQEQMKTRMSRKRGPGKHQPPRTGMFWMVNSGD